MNLADFHLPQEPVTGPAGGNQLEILRGWRPAVIPKASPSFELCDQPGGGQRAPARSARPSLLSSSDLKPRPHEGPWQQSERPCGLRKHRRGCRGRKSRKARRQRLCSLDLEQLRPRSHGAKQAGPRVSVPRSPEGERTCPVRQGRLGPSSANPAVGPFWAWARPAHTTESWLRDLEPDHHSPSAHSAELFFPKATPEPLFSL